MRHSRSPSAMTRVPHAVSRSPSSVLADEGIRQAESATRLDGTGGVSGFASNAPNGSEGGLLDEARPIWCVVSTLAGCHANHRSQHRPTLHRHAGHRKSPGSAVKAHCRDVAVARQSCRGLARPGPRVACLRRVNLRAENRQRPRRLSAGSAPPTRRKAVVPHEDGDGILPLADCGCRCDRNQRHHAGGESAHGAPRGR